MNQADILAEKVLDDVLEETVIEMQRWVISMQFYRTVITTYMQCFT